jgi:hypothetical protein
VKKASAIVGYYMSSQNGNHSILSNLNELSQTLKKYARNTTSQTRRAQQHRMR